MTPNDRSKRPRLRKSGAKEGRRLVGKGWRLPAPCPLAMGVREKVPPVAPHLPALWLQRGPRPLSGTLWAPICYGDGEPPGSRDPHPGLALGGLQGLGS